MGLREVEENLHLIAALDRMGERNLGDDVGAA